MEMDIRGRKISEDLSVERILTDIFCEVLGVGEVDLDENFFTMGGTSLRALMVVSRIHSLLSLKFPVSVIFESPKIRDVFEELYKIHKDHQGAPATSSITSKKSSLAKTSRDIKIAPTSMAQKAVWHGIKWIPRENVDAREVVRFQGELDVGSLTRSLEEVVRRHEALRTHIEKRDGKLLQIIHPASSFQLKFIDVSSHVVPEDEAKKLVYDTVWGPYNLETGPLFRALLLKLSPLEYILAITIHDLVADGPSLEILVRETSLLYESISKGNKSPLPEPIAQYSDFSSWQNECLIKEQGQESSSQKTEAMNQWVGQTEVSSNILKEPIVFSSALAEGLIELSEQENTTLFITVVTAYFLFLSRWKNKYDLTIAAPVVIRPDYKFEQVMGIFVQAIVLTVNLPENPNFAQTLRQVKNEFQKEYAKIFNLALNPTSAGAYSSTPPIDASINFLNYSPTSWSLPGINSTKYALPSPPVDQELPIDFHLQLEVDNKNISGSIVYIGDGVEIDELKKISKNFIELLNDFAKI